MNEIISSAKLMGGLGNQMFQIANALCQGWKNNVNSKFKYTDYKPIQGKSPKNYYNNVFRNVLFDTTLPKVKMVREKHWNEADLNVIFDESIEFFGYYQSSRNFLGFESKIKEFFSPTDDFNSKMIIKYPEIVFDNTLSVHIRRGDYLKTPSVHPVLDVSYFQKSINKIGDYDYLFVFSDDLIWAKENIKFEKTIFVSGIDDFEELWLMSLCKNNIISNSTFSWWSSFLNKNENKRVIAPSIWFGPNGPQPHNNIYEKYWEIIPVEFKNGILITK